MRDWSTLKLMLSLSDFSEGWRSRQDRFRPPELVLRPDRFRRRRGVCLLSLRVQPSVHKVGRERTKVRRALEVVLKRPFYHICTLNSGSDKNGDKEDCVEAKMGRDATWSWNDVQCSRKGYFICQKVQMAAINEGRNKGRIYPFHRSPNSS